MDTIAGAPLRLFIAHPLPLLRRALQLQLAGQPDIDVVGECWAPADACELVRQTHPDISVLGLGEDSRAWLDACSAITALGSKVLVVHEDVDSEVTTLAAQAGAEGFVSVLSAGLSTVVTAVRALARDESWVPRVLVTPLLRALVAKRNDDDVATARFARLSKRERDVLMLVVAGLEHDQIADRLVLSPHTVRTHIQHVLEKLEVHSRLEAVSMVLTHRLVERFGQRSGSMLPG